MPAATLALVSFAGTAVTWPEGRSAVDERPSGGLSTPFAAWEAPTRASAIPRETRSSRPTALTGAGPPRRVLITSLGVDAPVLAVESEERSLDPPPDPQALGWWSAGARPGDARGSALIVGHTVHDGGGALDHLETIRTGTDIRVQTTHGVVRYVAESVVVLDKATIARRAPGLFSQEAPGRLVLVTCEDWDGSGYRSNVVVTATPRA